MGCSNKEQNNEQEIFKDQFKFLYESVLPAKFLLVSPLMQRYNSHMNHSPINVMFCTPNTSLEIKI
jgi:hypothetical protein